MVGVSEHRLVALAAPVARKWFILDALNLLHQTLHIKALSPKP